jgi:hypothetical protein
MNAAASAFDNGYNLALAVTALALAAGSAFTYRYLTRQPTAPTQQTQHPNRRSTGFRCRERVGGDGQNGRRCVGLF